MFLKIILIALGIIIILKLVEKFVFPIAWVQGISMLPTYKHHDLVIFSRLVPLRSIKKGNVVIMANPYSIDEETGKPKLIIKRVTSIRYRNGKPSELYIVGDNTENSYDSRSFGYLPVKCLYAKAIYSRKQKGQLYETGKVDKN